MTFISAKLKKLVIATLLLAMVGGILMPPILAYAQAPTADNTDETAIETMCNGWVIDNASFQCLAAWFAYLMLTATGKLLGLAAAVLNWVVLKFVIQMGATINAIDAIPRTWIVLRDIGNLIFVFAMLVIGIATILRIQSYGYKQLLFRLIIAALLINFSLFFAKITIDVANLFSQAAYQQIEMAGNTDASCENADPIDPNDPNTASCIDQGLAGAFMQQFKLTTLFERPAQSIGEQAATQGNNLSLTNVFILGIFGSIMLIVASFVFIAAAILLAVRFVVLTFLIILSPIAFAGAVLPQTRSIANRWWQALFSQAFFAPVLLLFFWVSLQVLSSISNYYGQDSGVSSALLGDGNTASILVVFMLAIGFLFGSLMAAQSLGAYGAGKAVSLGKSMGRGAAGGVAAYSAGFVSQQARQRFERANARLEQTKGGQKLRKYSNMALRTLSLGAVGGKEIRNALQKGEEKKYFGASSLADRQKATKQYNRDIAGVQRELNVEDAAKTLQSTESEMHQLRAEIRQLAAAGKDTAAKETRLAGLENLAEYRDAVRTMKGANVKLLEKLDEKMLTNPHVAQHLKSSQIDDLNKSEEFTDQQKGAIKKAKWLPLEQAVKGGDTEYLNKTIPRLGGAEIRNLSDELLTNEHVIDRLSSKDLNALDRADGKLTDPQMSEIRKRIKTNAAEAERLKALDGELTPEQAKILQEKSKSLEAAKFFESNAGRLWPE